MVSQRDTKGRFQGGVVLGRKFCPQCGRWKHLLYFRPRRLRNGREYPNSPCDGCHNRKEKRGRKTMTGDRLARRQEYERFHKEVLRRRKGIPIRNLRTRQDCLGPDVDFYLDGKRVMAYLERLTVMEEMEDNRTRLRLNGVIVPDNEARYLRHLRGGTVKHVSLSKADRLARDYHIPLWELEEAAAILPD